MGAPDAPPPRPDFRPSRAAARRGSRSRRRSARGGILALTDPETGKAREALYDAESTSGPLRFSDGEEATVVWTRMSGAAGALVGAAILADGDVLALSIAPAKDAQAERPFVLFAATGAALFRGSCAPAPHRGK